MAYSICGLIIPQPEERACSERGWPCVTLRGGVSLIPRALTRDYLLLTEGDETEPAADFHFDLPAWLSEMGSCFSRSAYVEAEFWGGIGMQASVVLERSRILSGPLIASNAINCALRHLGINDARVTFIGPSTSPDGDAFDMVGLGRHRSVDGWLQESAKRTAAPIGGPAEPSGNSGFRGVPPSGS